MVGPPRLLKESPVNDQLKDIMVEFDSVVSHAGTTCEPVRAAHMLAIDRVAPTIRQRGIYA